MMASVPGIGRQLCIEPKDEDVMVGKKIFWRCVRVTAIGLLVVFLVAGAGPSVITLGWHMFHKEPQRYGRLNIIVPRSFIAWNSTDDIWLVRMKTISSPDLFKFESIVFKHDSGHASLEKWKENGLRAARTEKGIKYFTISIGGNSSPCIEFDGDLISLL